ncbi:hypothetical protein NLJ89_g9722 [Agrocybe chaxingu]|uniref:Uncharacterized protein n=1 Tax=Agrocybe chaxingu TaxID=84603 RepID=A0A9W8JVD3_9AGAR|nr:hypothetical protein NLJ89_g9722 [Agrocybe chaxingu]
MSGSDSKEDINALDYDLRDPEKSLENQADTSSTYTAHDSAILSIFDPNFDSSSVLEDDSPYPEVRSAVANFDDPEMPASTFRAWILGLFWAILISGMNQFFYFRYPSVAIGGLVAQLLVFPIGRAWVRLCPSVTVFGVQMNPGPFTIKEHVLVTIMASVGAQSAYATDIVAVQRVYYNQAWSFAYNWMLVMSTQLIGFSMGGIARRFLVAPPSMIWPNTLVSCALFNTLHSQTYAGIGPRDGLSRERFFLYAFVAAIIWCMLDMARQRRKSLSPYPLHYPPVVLLAPPVALNEHLLMTMLDDRTESQPNLRIAFIGSPLATPWWAEANVMIGFFVFYWFLTPLLYYKNVWHSQYMPISGLNAYDNTGNPYDVSRVVNPIDASLNLDAYKAYSPLYLPTAFAMSYGLSFLSITSTVTHAIIHFYRPIRLQFGRSMREQPDIHARLMSRYPQVPEWYYACLFVVTFIFACVCIELWPSGMTIWALVIALLISVVYVLPIGMIQAVTNRQVGLNVITELIVGFMIPGKPNAMMIYMKVPPRPMFWCQVVATVIAGTVQLGVQSWMFSNITDICDRNQPNNFTCASTQVFGTASIIWGVIGPGLQFTKGQIYYGMHLIDHSHGLTFFFLIGAACPVILWLFTRRYPNTILNYLNFPLIFSGVGSIPPATAVNYVPWAIIGFIFQYVVRRKHFSYWAKYNYVLSAALDAGTGIGLIMVFFCLQYPLDGNIGRNTIQKWWGNRVYKNTLDWKSTPLRKLTDGDTFGFYPLQRRKASSLFPSDSELDECLLFPPGEWIHAITHGYGLLEQRISRINRQGKPFYSKLEQYTVASITHWSNRMWRDVTEREFLVAEVVNMTNPDEAVRYVRFYRSEDQTARLETLHGIVWPKESDVDGSLKQGIVYAMLTYTDPPAGGLTTDQLEDVRQRVAKIYKDNIDPDATSSESYFSGQGPRDEINCLKRPPSWTTAIKRTTFTPKNLSYADLFIIAIVAHQCQPLFNIFRRQSHWYASTMMDLIRDWEGDEVRAVDERLVDCARITPWYANAKRHAYYTIVPTEKVRPLISQAARSLYEKERGAHMERMKKAHEEYTEVMQLEQRVQRLQMEVDALRKAKEREEAILETLAHSRCSEDTLLQPMDERNETQKTEELQDHMQVPMVLSKQ